jgi:hypothetical protein
MVGFRVSGDRITRLPCYRLGETPRREGAGRITAQADLKPAIVALDDQV